MPCPPSLLRFFFLPKSKLVARKQGRCAEKTSALPFQISNCGFRIFLVFFQSAFRNLQSAIPMARPVQEMMRASCFFRATPLLSGRAMPEIQSILRLLGEKCRWKSSKCGLPFPRRSRPQARPDLVFKSAKIRGEDAMADFTCPEKLLPGSPPIGICLVRGGWSWVPFGR